MTSLSTRFFAQPRLTNPTLMLGGELMGTTNYLLGTDSRISGAGLVFGW